MSKDTERKIAEIDAEIKIREELEVAIEKIKRTLGEQVTENQEMIWDLKKEREKLLELE